jgi:6-phosphogluconolactonase (cycloisomerase 2 family)
MRKQATRIALSITVSATLLGCSVNSINPNVSSATRAFVYTGNVGTVFSTFTYGTSYQGSLSGFSMDTSTGVLTPLSGFPLTVGAGASAPLVLTHDPQNRFLFVADRVSTAVHVFTINSTTGALAEVQGSPYALPIPPSAVLVDPTGQFLYVSDHVSRIETFTISSTGALTPVPGSLVNLGGRAIISGAYIDALHLSADGRFLYYANGSQLVVYAVDLTSGVATKIQGLVNHSANNAGGFAFDPTGKYLYAMSNSTSYLETYTIDPTSGLLAEAYQNTLLVETLGNATFTLSPSGNYAYTVENGNSLVTYAVSNGVFTPIGTPLTGFNSQQLLIDSTGSFLYAPQVGSSEIAEFAIGSGGRLTALSPATVASGIGPTGITMVTQ